MARALARGLLVGLVGLITAGVVPTSEGSLRPLDWLLFFSVLSGLAGAVAVAAVRERRTFDVEGPAGADTERVEHLLALVIWTIAFFVLVYARLAGIPGQFVGLETRLDAFYFTFTTLATVGFGEVHATGQAARLAVTVQIVFNLVVVALAVQVLITALRRQAPGPGVEGRGREGRT